MRLLPLTTRIASPWKNGGGMTSEVAIFPPRSGLDDFGWRLSMAVVSSDGPFSKFDGVDRTLAVISPGQLKLRRPDGSTILLDQTSEPYTFAGEDAVVGEVGAPGGVSDLNLMTRRGEFRGVLRRLELRQSTAIGECHAETVIFALDDLEVSGGIVRALEAVWLETGEMAAVAPWSDWLTAPARLLAAHIWPVTARS